MAVTIHRLLSALLIACGVLAWPGIAHATYSVYCSNARVTLVINYGGESELVAITYAERGEEGAERRPTFLEPTFWRIAGQQVLAFRKRAQAEWQPFHVGVRGPRGVLIVRQQRHFLRCEWDTE